MRNLSIKIATQCLENLGESRTLMLCLIFIEEKESFNRYDIIERIGNVARNSSESHLLLFLILRNDLVEIIVLKNGVEWRMITIIDQVRSVIDRLISSKEVVELREEHRNAGFNKVVEEVCKYVNLGRCFTLGLHSDYRKYTLSKLGLASMGKVALGRVSYTTSFCVIILLFLKKLCQHE